MYLNKRGQELNMGSGNDRCGGLFLILQTVQVRFNKT
jgi:hypothetical protein